MAETIEQRLQLAIEKKVKQLQQDITETSRQEQTIRRMMEPVISAAERVRSSLVQVPNSGVFIENGRVRIQLGHRRLRYEYDARSNKWTCCAYLAGLPPAIERIREWASADACIESMIEDCAEHIGRHRAVSSDKARALG